MVFKIVLIRHGESTWNVDNRFTGWTDVDLSARGLEEARRSARVLRDGEYTFDEVHTSLLKRAIRTMWTVMDDLDLMWLPVFRTWRLNERHYGALQGLNKSETAAKHGEDQVKVWRRSYDVPPPPLEEGDERDPRLDRRYASVDPALLPRCESLKDTVDRVLPYWNETIWPSVRAGKRVLVVAHGNSLRALVKYLENMPNEEIVELNIPTGVPLVYELNEDQSVVAKYYLGDQEEIAAAMAAVAAQGAKKP